MKPAGYTCCLLLVLGPLVGCYHVDTMDGEEDPAASESGDSSGSDVGSDDSGESEPGSDGETGSGGEGMQDGDGDQVDPSSPTDVPAGEWENVTNNLVDLAGEEAGELTLLSSRPGEDRIIVGVPGSDGLYASYDGGDSWEAMGTADGSDAIDHVPMSIVYDPDVADRWWVVGIYGAGLFETNDDGDTFRHLGDTSHNDLVGIDFTDPERNTMLLGGHEAKVLWLSRDGGDTWTDIGPSLPGEATWSTLPVVIDEQTFLLGSNGGAGGVFRTDNGGETWTRTYDEPPTVRPLLSDDGSLYWLRAGGGMIKSDDAGETWTRCADGPIDMFYGPSPQELPDGRLVTLGSDSLLISDDECASWAKLGEPLPFGGGACKIYGFNYSASAKALFINHNDCSGGLLPDAVFRADFDHTES